MYHAWERQKHNLSYNVHCSKIMRLIYLIISMTNCHIVGFDLPFTELNYLIWFLCQLRLNTGDWTLDTLYIVVHHFVPIFNRESKSSFFYHNMWPFVFCWHFIHVSDWNNFLLTEKLKTFIGVELQTIFFKIFFVVHFLTARV